MVYGWFHWLKSCEAPKCILRFWKNARFPQACWLLDMHNFHQLTISLQDLEMYAALALRSRNPQDNLTIWLARMTLGDFTCFFFVTCTLTASSFRTLSTYKLNAQSHLRHAHSNCSWCVQIANNLDIFFKRNDYEKTTNRIRELTDFLFFKIN